MDPLHLFEEYYRGATNNISTEKCVMDQIGTFNFKYVRIIVSYEQDSDTYIILYCNNSENVSLCAGTEECHSNVLPTMHNPLHPSNISHTENGLTICSTSPHAYLDSHTVICFQHYYYCMSLRQHSN